MNTLRVVAAPKGAEAYAWLTYTGPRLPLVSKQGSSVVLTNGTKIGVRKSGDGKKIRMVVGDAINKVFTLPSEIAAKIAKTTKPLKTKGRKEDENELQEDSLDGHIQKLAAGIKAFKKNLKGIPEDSVLVKAKRIQDSFYNKFNKVDKDNAKAVDSLLTKYLQFLETLSKAKLAKVSKDPKLNGFAASLLKVAKTSEDYWSDELDPFMLTDVIDWLLLASAFLLNDRNKIEKRSRGDTAWREEIPDKAWDWIQENAR